MGGTRIQSWNLTVEIWQLKFDNDSINIQLSCSAALQLCNPATLLFLSVSPPVSVSKKFSISAACEFADVDLYTFLEACQQNGIDTINHDPDEVEADILRLASR